MLVLLLAFTIIVAQVSHRHSGEDHTFKKKEMQEKAEILGLVKLFLFSLRQFRILEWEKN